MNKRELPAGTGPVDGEVRPRAWTLQSELDAGDSTCGAHLWFVNPRNSSWAPLYDQAALEAAVAAERERCARLCIERSFQMTGADEYQTAAACADLIRRA